jgi:hypothetical protein
LEDKFSKKAIQMFSESAGVADGAGTQASKHEEPETVREAVQTWLGPSYMMVYAFKLNCS